MNKKIVLVIGLISLFIMSLSTVFAQTAQKVDLINVNLHYNQKRVTITSIEKVYDTLPDYLNQPEDGYTLELLDKNSESFFKLKFSFPLDYIYDDFSTGTLDSSQKTLAEVSYSIAVPAFPNTEKVSVIDPEGQVVAYQAINLESLTEEDQQKAKEQAQQAQKIPALKLTPINILGLVFIIAIVAFGLFSYWKHKQNIGEKVE